MTAQLWRRGRKVLIAAGALVVVVLTGGMTAEAVGSRMDARRFPARGEMVDIGGYRININCTGAGSPTVVLDSGLGVHARSWELVQGGVERFARVCSYDRAGYGWSERGPQPRSSFQIARELHTLLNRANTPGPYVLVGHSFGGYNVRVYAGLYRDEVSGMVLVDSSHEDQERFVPETARAQAAGLRKLAPFVPALQSVGVLRLRDRLQPTVVSGSKLSAATMEELSALALRPHFLPTVLQEYSLLGGESAAQVRASGDLGDIPLIVLTAGRATEPGNSDQAAFRKAWMEELQPGLVKLSRQGRQVVVEASDHMIPYRDPDSVVRAIQAVWKAARERR